MGVSFGFPKRCAWSLHDPFEFLPSVNIFMVVVFRGSKYFWGVKRGLSQVPPQKVPGPFVLETGVLGCHIL